MIPEQLLKEAYRAFNARDIDAALLLMCSDVMWPNGMEGGHVHGRDGIREYWTRQWAQIDPIVVPLSIRALADGRFEVEVEQTIKDLQGVTLRNAVVFHVYQLRGGLIGSMEIRE